MIAFVLRSALLAATLGIAAVLPAQDGMIVLRGARVLPMVGEPIDDGVVILFQGRIRSVGGPGSAIPEGAQVIDCKGKVITPGLVDAGTTLGLDPVDANEQGQEVTPQVSVLDALDPDHIGLRRALRHGVTTVQVNPGNRNVIGGLGAVVKTQGSTIPEMLLRDESGLRLTLGLEPQQGNRAIRGGTPVGIYYRRPNSRMGTIWAARQAFYQARDYGDRRSIDPDQPDAGMEVLLRALNGELIVRTTARAEQDIRTALRLADEFGYRTLLEEATEAWSMAEELAASEVPVLIAAPSLSRDNRDGAELRYHTLNLLAQHGVPFAIHTGTAEDAMPLVYEAMFAMRNGLSAEQALAAITSRPAELLSVADRVGSLQPGLDADLVIWTGHPLDPGSSIEAIYLQGREVTP